MSRSKDFSVYENLDTSFVNLGALLRYLQQQDFEGHVRVRLDQYEADVTLRAGEKPQARERDAATGREAAGEAALQRLLVRAQDPGGRISVYREAAETRAVAVEPEIPSGTKTVAEEARASSHSTEELDRGGLLRASAELIGAVQHALLSVGANFDAAFRAAQLELADDYAFFDPNSGRFRYADHKIELEAGTGTSIFVSGLCEALRRVVEKASVGKQAASVRERVALELAVLARHRALQLEEFGILPRLDRIAGTRVI